MKRLFTIVLLLICFLGANADEVVDVEIDYTTVTSDAWYGGWRSESAAERVSVVPGEGIYFQSEEATDPFYDVQFQLPGVPVSSLDSDATYTITIKIKGSVEQSIRGYFSGSDEFVDIPVANDWQTLTFSGCKDNPNAHYFASSGSLLIQCGNYVGDWTISYIKISHEEGGDSQLYFNYIKKGKVAELIQNPNKYKGTVIIPSKVTHEGVKYTVTKIAENAFNDCSGLTSVTIPNSVTSIASYAFKDCSGLTSVTIPNSVTSIGSYAFNNCSGLTSITIPNSVTSIGWGAFVDCSSLTSVFIPNSVTFIVDHAFEDCSGLTSVTIPNSVTSIGSSAFNGCSDLTSVTIPNSVTSIGSRAFSYCSGMTSVTIPNSVTSIGWGAFADCSSLTSVTIPNSVTSIVAGVFEYCSGLTSVTIPNSVTSIGEYAFAYCSGLTSITIGSGIKYIYNQAFANCPELTDVYCYAENVPSTNVDAFEGSYIEYATLHVPKGCIGAYKDVKPWKNFKSIVEIVDAKVELNKTEANIEKGKTLTLKATITPSDLADKSVTWKSSNKKVATVSSSGKVKGVKVGTATITCTSNATGLKATCTVNVVNGLVTLNKTEACVQKGKTMTLKATVTPKTLADKSVTWKSSDTKIATVTKAGKVKGVKYGTATIACTSVATGAKATCQVTVGKVVVSISEVSIKKSRGITLEATVYPEDLADKSVTWKSSDKSIATVDKEGRVKGIKAGTATITCTSVATGLKGTCTVTVLSNSEARSMIGDDDELTGLKELESSAAAEPFDVYDLSGRKVLHQVTSLDGLSDGIYIVNGKKILKKK